jgi:hypothetical protein
MRDDFAVFILTHGRAERVYTLATLASHNYTGRVYLVVDDEDPELAQYRARYGAAVLTFSKAEIAARFDQGDNFTDRRAIFYARNACFDLARAVGVRYFLELDDDYSGFYYRFDASRRYGNWKLEPLDWLFSAVVDYLAATPFASIAISQGGDHIGGGASKPTIGAKRKAMNSFFCDVERPFAFLGRVNEDVNTYTAAQRAGLAFLTIVGAQLNQKATQSNAGGMSGLYADAGTFVKSFYTVMYAPSCARVAVLRDPRGAGGHARIHHVIDWNATAPKILRAEHRRAP